MTSNQQDIKKSLIYKLSVQIYPQKNRINAEVRIQHPPDTVFYLNSNFNINRISTNGNKLPFHQLIDETLPLTVGTAIRVDGEYEKEIEVEYTGTIEDVINNVNLIQSDLVELAIYAAWYPMYKGVSQFKYELTLDIPSTHITTTNGIQMNVQVVNDRNISTWQSSERCFDIVIISSPTFHTLEKEKGKTRIELFHSLVPEEYMLENMDVLETAVHTLSYRYGPAETGGILRCVNSPRKGWGYSRMPLVVMPEDYILSQLDQEFGKARIFHGIVHELAHFWWLISDTNSPDDWINEGLAEFSAYRLSEELFGKEFTAKLIKEYEEHITQAQNGTCIAETTGTSENRYVNRYEKTTVMYIEAQRRYGEQTLDNLFRMLYKRFSQSADATTEQFIGEVRSQMGSDAVKFFKAALYQKEWKDPSKLP